jgi:hypothetical protein
MGRYYVSRPGGVVCETDEVLEFGRWYATSGDVAFKDGGRRVALDEHLPGDLWVSTVFLGINHAFDRTRPPVLFETMVFPSGGLSELYGRRYATAEEALAGHAHVVAKIRAGEPLEE